MLYINAEYRRKILTKWVLCVDDPVKDPKILAKLYYSDLYTRSRTMYRNHDMTWWHKHIWEY